MEAAMNAMDEMAERSGTPLPPGSVQRRQRNAERAMAALKWNLDAWARPFAENSASGKAEMSRLVLAVTPSTLPTGNNPADWARVMVNDPAYQLK